MKASPEVQKKIEVALENLKGALVGLKEGCNKTTVSNLELSGTIQHFEFCYELSWKLLQKRGAIDGRTLASPRESFRYGFERGYIENDKTWAEMINDRNETVHTYDATTAKKIYKQAKDTYLAEFEKLVVNFDVPKLNTYSLNGAFFPGKAGFGFVPWPRRHWWANGSRVPKALRRIQTAVRAANDYVDEYYDFMPI